MSQIRGSLEWTRRKLRLAGKVPIRLRLAIVRAKHAKVVECTFTGVGVAIETAQD